MTQALDPMKPFILTVVLISGEQVDLPVQAANLEAARALAQDTLGKAKKGEPFELVPGYWVAADAVMGVRYRNLTPLDLAGKFRGE